MNPVRSADDDGKSDRLSFREGDEASARDLHGKGSTFKVRRGSKFWFYVIGLLRDVTLVLSIGD